MTIADGPDVGKSVTTSGSGTYTLNGLQQASLTITVSATGFVTESMKVTAAPNQFVTIVLAFTALNVDVFDALVEGDVFRHVPGATVQLLDGPQAGASAVTDAKGVARFEGAFGAPLTLSIRKDGYDPLQTPAQMQSSGSAGPGTSRIDLELKAPDLVRLASGKYSITIATDGNCQNIPADLQTRTYAASAAPFTGARAGDGYTLTPDSSPQAFELDVIRARSASTLVMTWPFGDPSSGLSMARHRHRNRGNVAGIGRPSILRFYQFRYQGEACSGSNGLFRPTSQ